MTAVYNQAKRSPCVLRFHIAAEGGWDIGVTTGLSFAALLTWLGFPIAYGILISLVGAIDRVLPAPALLTRPHPSEAIDATLDIGEFQIQAGEAPKI